MMNLEAAPSTAAERARRCHEFADALEEERRKIQVFQRELPLSFHLVSQTIESYKKKMTAKLFAASGVTRSEAEGDMSSEGDPVFEEFIPIKRSSSSDGEEDEEAGDRLRHDRQHGVNDLRLHDQDSSSTCRQKPQEMPEKKPDWLRAVRLWSQQPDPQPLRTREEDDVDTRRRPIAVETRKAIGAFLPFRQQKSQSPSPAPLVHEEVAPEPAATPPVPTTSSTSDSMGGGVGGGRSGCGGGVQKDGQLHRKARRSWSPELHRLFVNALQQLGGSDAATPKRIRELMKVDGMTNDEVKSHLQKYRLHSRRPTPTTQGNAGNVPPQQLLFVGGIWVPTPEYAASAAAAAAVRPSAAEGIAARPPCGIYAPVASVPARKQQLQAPDNSQRCPRGPPPVEGGRSLSRDDEATRSNSPTASSSSLTTTASPARR